MYTNMNDVTYRKITFFIISPVRTSNLTLHYQFGLTRPKSKGCNTHEVTIELPQVVQNCRIRTFVREF